MIFCLGSMASTIDLGYVNKRLGSSTNLKVSSKDNSSAAIRLTQESLARYAGNEVRSVRIGLPSLSLYVDSIVVWVRSSLDGENMATGKITRFNGDGYPGYELGWNRVELSTPCKVPASGDLYVGYTYYQRTTVCATTANSKGEEGYSYVRMGKNGEWQEFSGEGALCIEAGVDGASMPQYDVWLQSAKGIVSADGSVNVDARLFNRGQAEATSLTFEMTVGGQNREFVVPAAVAPNALDTVRFVLDGLSGEIAPGNDIDIELARINGNADEFGDDNVASCLFNYQSYLLVEEFTTENCPNCPAMAEKLHNYMDGGYEYSKQVLMVCHHAGYGTDDFTTTSDIEYTWFYNNGGSTYAPAVMFNRKQYQETSYGTTPVVFPYSIDEIGAYAGDCLDRESSLILSSEAVLDASGSAVTLTVKGKKMDGFNVDNPRIFVFLTEDNVLANGQAGSGTSTYYHNHVVRAQNATWGDAIEWAGDEFTYTCSFDLNTSWKTGDMKLIASVGNYDSTNPGNCAIENSTVATFGNVNGIVLARPATDKVVYSYYSVNGMRLSKPLENGVTIVKGSDGTLKKIAHALSD